MTEGAIQLSVCRPEALGKRVTLAVSLMSSLMLSACDVKTPAADAWGPVVELRDDSDMWPKGKPMGGWWVTPIHATLLPSGQVLITGWGRRDHSDCKEGGTRKKGVTFLLDPAKLTGNSSNVVPVDEQGSHASDVLYCAGHGPLADGRVLFSGGARYERLGKPGESELGLNYARLYNPIDNSFMRVGKTMTGGPDGEEGIRWYPTNTRLAGSNVLVTGGFTRYGGSTFGNLSVELFDYQRLDASKNPWHLIVSHRDGLPDMTPDALDYTHVYLLPSPLLPVRGNGFGRQVAMLGGSGKVLLLNYTDELSRRDRFMAPLNGQRGARSDGSTGALLSSGEILVLGGADSPITGQRADFYDPQTDTWKSVNTNIGRVHAASVLLPDGTVLILNGEGRPGFVGDRRQPQTIDPVTHMVTSSPSWPDDPFERGYHNFALLLKDGRVLLGGGKASEQSRVGCERPDVRIYTPGYLSKGPRPSLVEVLEPVKMTVGGQEVSFHYTNGPIRSGHGVVLMALGSTTHSFDQNQRYIALDFQVPVAGTVKVTPPANYFQAPAGDYILFILSDLGVPSEGKHVWLD